MPQTPHADTLQNPRLLIRDASGAMLVVYCPKNKVGGVYDLTLQAWSIFGPLTAADFVAALPKLGVRLAESPDLHVWLDAISKTTTLRPN